MKILCVVTPEGAARLSDEDLLWNIENNPKACAPEAEILRAEALRRMKASAPVQEEKGR